VVVRPHLTKTAFLLVSTQIRTYHTLKPDEIAFPQVSDSRTAVPKLRTTPLTCRNREVVRAAVPLNLKPQVRGSYHRTPYGVASSWYAATPGIPAVTDEVEP
jgi:hypothetical protein